MVKDLRCSFFFSLTASKRENHVNICHWRAPLAKSCNRPALCVIRLVKLSLAQTQIEEGTLSIWMRVVPAAATSSCFYWFFCPQLYNRSSVLGLNLNHIVWRASVSHKSRKHFDTYEIGFLSTVFGSPSGEICVTTEWMCGTKVYVCRFFFPSYVFQVVELKTKRHWHKTFECTVQQATTQALTNLCWKALGLVLPVHSWLF